jgi:hypothetical protein
MNTDEDCNVVLLCPNLDKKVQVFQSPRSQHFPFILSRRIMIIKPDNPVSYRHSDSIEARLSDFRNIALLDKSGPVLFEPLIPNAMP